MLELIKNLSDFAKFFLLLMVYIFGMTWWAASLTSQVQTNTERIMETKKSLHDYIIYDTVEMKNVIAQGKVLENIQKNQEQLQKLMQQTVESHAKCAGILDGVLERLKQLERDIRSNK
jgi:hypothetical protein